MNLRIDIDGVLAGLVRYATDMTACVESAGRNAASGMEDYAKNNRPWTDRTGNARRTMEGVCAWNQQGQFVVGVEGHMPYSVFLELGYGGKYSILAPTVHHFAPAFLLELADGSGRVR